MKAWTKLLVLGAVVAMVASACGDDDDDTPDATSAPSGEEISLGFSAWPGWIPWQVAEEQGLFAEAGVAVDLVWFESYTDSLNALAAGQLDANSQTLNDTISSVAADSDQVIILVNDNSTGNDQIIASEDIESIEDLKGKRIGVEIAVVDNYLLLLGLESVGLTADDVEIVPLETGAAAAAFASGQLDAVGVFAPFTTTAMERDGAHVLFSSEDFPGAIPDHLVVSRELIEERPEDVQKLIDAWYLTMEWIEENPEEAIEIMAERAGVSTEEYESYDAGTTLFTIEDNIEAFEDGDDFTSLRYAAEDIMEFMIDQGLIEDEIDLDAIFDSQFVEAHAQAN
ncbi:MAG TPA: ABC transporter substrate-binding protein [Tepidiformaceae bacterium]|nr:ABC transporter substrate-binding protein [Tepidiformaceae bacterium]